MTPEQEQIAALRRDVDRMRRDADLQQQFPPAGEDIGSFDPFAAPLHPGGSSGGKHVFELYDRTATTFKVRGCQGKEVEIGGVWATITAGTGSKALAADITITETAWVWIALNKSASGGTATLNFAAAASLPASDDDTEIYPIAYVPFASSAITWGDVVQARSTTIHWLAE